jgi:hypothetical protein
MLRRFASVSFQVDRQAGVRPCRETWMFLIPARQCAALERKDLAMWKRLLPWCAVAGMTAVLVILAGSMAAGPALPALAGQEAKGPKEPKEPQAGPKAKPEGNGTTSRIVAVTVYPKNALVTREVDVPAGQGMTELTVSLLPPAIIPSSLYSEGSNGNRILTTRYRSRPVLQDTREDVRKLLTELAQLNTAREKLEADSRAVQENFKMLGKMEGFLGVTTIQSTEKGQLNVEAAITLSKHIKEARLETSRESVNLLQQLKANFEKVDFA